MRRPSNHPCRWCLVALIAWYADAARTSAVSAPPRPALPLRASVASAHGPAAPFPHAVSLAEAAAIGLAARTLAPTFGSVAPVPEPAPATGLPDRAAPAAGGSLAGLESLTFAADSQVAAGPAVPAVAPAGTDAPSGPRLERPAVERHAVEPKRRASERLMVGDASSGAGFTPTAVKVVFVRPDGLYGITDALQLPDGSISTAPEPNAGWMILGLLVAVVGGQGWRRWRQTRAALASAAPRP